MKFGLMTLIWGSTYLWIKLAVQEIGPFTLVSLRTVFAISGILILVLKQRTSILIRRRWPIFLFLGVINMGLPFVLTSWAGKIIPSGLSAILNSTIPLWTILIASALLPEERFTASRLIGVVFGFGGVIVLMSNRLSGELGAYQLGMLAMLVSALLYAVSSILIRLKAKGIPAEALSFGQLLFAWLAVTPGAVLFEAPFQFPTQVVTWAAVIFLGLFASGLSLVLYFSLLHEIGPTRTAMGSYIQPLISVALGALVLGEQLDWRMVLGGMMIIAGVWWVNKRRK